MSFWVNVYVVAIGCSTDHDKTFEWRRSFRCHASDVDTIADESASVVGEDSDFVDTAVYGVDECGDPTFPISEDSHIADYLLYRSTLPNPPTGIDNSPVLRVFVSTNTPNKSTKVMAKFAEYRHNMKARAMNIARVSQASLSARFGYGKDGTPTDREDHSMHITELPELRNIIGVGLLSRLSFKRHLEELVDCLTTSLTAGFEISNIA